MNIQKLKEKIACLDKNKYAIAVSGGSDSLALLHLCAEFLDKEFTVLHFDHNVREESASEANFVEQTAKQLGFKFYKQVWDNKPTEGNFYQAARKARYEFFAQACKDNNLDGVLVAHSKTDLAETLLMRLGKGASLKGVSIFEQGKEIFGVKVYRPLLDFTRKDLQDYLEYKNISWVSDPSNLDENKMRPRIRAILPKLDNIGISLSGMLNATKYFNQASQALDYYMKNELKKFKSSWLGYYSISKNDFFSMPLEMQIKLVNYFIEEFSNEEKHLPRRKNIIELLKRLENNTTTIEPLDVIFIEEVEGKLFFYVNDDNYHGSLDNTLATLDKKTRYNLVKKHNLQFLPICIRNRVIINETFND
tara:strand:+ start:3088 stop:4176 length:1089 start_codon:yes stop_codon:yes gene_type:complete